MPLRSVLIIISLLSFTCLYTQSGEQQNEVKFTSGIKIEDISEQRISNLFKLCKTWGLVKYKHPIITNDSIDWDTKLFKFIKLTNNTDFDSILYKNLPPLNNELSKTVTRKRLKGINRDDLFPNLNRLYLEALSSYELQENQQYVEPGKWDITPTFKENKFPDIDYNDDGIKLLSLFRYWNIIEYFFPYKNLMEDDWDKILLEFIPKFLITEDELSFKLTLLELVCKIKDGHGGIHNDETLNKYFGLNQIPIELKLINNKVYIVRLFDEIRSAPEIVVGDEIVEIDGTAIDELMDQKKKYIAASTEAAKNRQLSEFILRTNKDFIEVKIQKQFNQLLIKIPTVKYNTLRYVQQKKPSHGELSNEIVYIYPGSLRHGELDSLLLSYIDKKSIIFDYRCYPSVNVQNKLPNFLLPYPTYAFKSTRYSDEKLGDFVFTKAYKWGEINESYYKGNFVILVNEYTQSQPEFETLIYAQAPSVTIIGSATSGAVGNWTPIFLPGNILTSISGNGIFRYDESPVQRIGIIPDIYVTRTIKGIRSGKDEILLRAIEYCNVLR